MSAARKYLCGTPSEHCTGPVIAVSAGLKRKSIKAHSSRLEAYKCYVRYLTKILGYTRIEGKSREFSPPGGKGPVRFLPKKSKFGGLLRRGKEGTRSMPEGVHGVMSLT
jgi:hypothetical protein